MKLTQILENVDSEILTEETLQRIEEAFNAAVESKVEERVQLEVESALIEMDEDHTAKLEQLVTAIDEDHTAKLNQVIESIDLDHTEKMKGVIRKYESELNNSAETHLEQLTEDIDKYLDAYVEELVPVELVEKAARNTYANKLLGEAKSVLSVDEKFATRQFREAVRDGAEQIDSLHEENEALRQKLNVAKATQYLEHRLSALPTAKAQFIKKRLSGKPYKFIKENFAFVEDMYEEKERDDSSSDLNTLPPVPKVDRQGQVSGGEIVTESNDSELDNEDPNNPYLGLYMEGMTNRY